MHALIISRHLKDSSKGENLGYNLGPNIGRLILVPIYFANVNLF
jgi:hypothetical protein